ncbi:MAG: dihydrofolate reductase [Oscillospiraceae bacterium]|nr:dihydrofolate reductase [Oscillospiraceae bacterium]MBQ6847196.1 dihydrofolate reductase [Oscillospiraceae bacterium]MBQ7119529.1 dihydrofolate reductase [Oscillospiraceae bacterium]
MNMIAAADLEWGIGKGGDLLYSIPEDMRFFRETTKEKTVIMGRATLESLPGGKPLPKRRNIIISRTLESVEGAEVCKSPEEVIDLLSDVPSEDIFVIGGESIYRDMLPYCDTAYITKIEAKSSADRYLVNLDKKPEWEIVKSSPVYAHNDICFKFLTYKRVK